MTLDTLREALARRPFEPFRVVLSSGTSYEVRHPEFGWLVKNGLYVGIPSGNGDLPERAVYCALLHIAAVETLAPA
ncbi:MAG: hypothetical protein HYS13_23740 [Planctomycetia bacterium]|nr:hypothetical protein [Planctomycetia bacterium]